MSTGLDRLHIAGDDAPDDDVTRPTDDQDWAVKREVHTLTLDVIGVET